MVISLYELDEGHTLAYFRLRLAFRNRASSWFAAVFGAKLKLAGGHTQGAHTLGAADVNY